MELSGPDHARPETAQNSKGRGAGAAPTKTETLNDARRKRYDKVSKIAKVPSTKTQKASLHTLGSLSRSTPGLISNDLRPSAAASLDSGLAGSAHMDMYMCAHAHSTVN